MSGSVADVSGELLRSNTAPSVGQSVRSELSVSCSGSLELNDGSIVGAKVATTDGVTGGTKIVAAVGAAVGSRSQGVMAVRKSGDERHTIATVRQSVGSAVKPKTATAAARASALVPTNISAHSVRGTDAKLSKNGSRVSAIDRVGRDIVRGPSGLTNTLTAFQSISGSSMAKAGLDKRETEPIGDDQLSQIRPLSLVSLGVLAVREAGETD